MEQAVDVKRVQHVLLGMAKSIATILENHSIPYMIAYGTLLGAVRHQGFIPWDDDFDFYLFDDTYDKAKEYLRNELPKSMFLEDEVSEPLFFHGWARVKDMNSEAFNMLYPQNRMYSHKGMNIDLFRTKKMKLSCLESFLNEENRKYIERRKRKGLISEEEYNLRSEVLRINEQKSNNINYVNDYDVFNLVPVYKCHYMKASSVFPLKRYKFENLQFLGPNNAEDILTSIYGNYMELPPEEKRRCHYSSVVFLDELK